MDDSIQYSTALELNVEAIISFDKYFDNLKIARKEPKTWRLKNKAFTEALIFLSNYKFLIG